MGIAKQRAPGDPDDLPPGEVSAKLSDGRKVVIKGLEPPVREDDQVETESIKQVPPTDDDANAAAARRGIAGF
jgi:hypothetical protein